MKEKEQRDTSTYPEEVGELVKALLINVTQFFHDAEAFTYLKSEILPKLITQAREHDHVLRFWTAGCATGEEPYSLAMLLANLLGAELPEWSIKIFATDLDRAAINFARQGIYSEALLKGVPNDYRDHFFEHIDQHYRISKTLRQMVIFGQQDLGWSAPFPRIDLILCRNVLIYFTPELQDTVLNQFAFSLYPNGYLFLGKAETVRPVQAYYELVNEQWKVYRCVGDALPLGHRQRLSDSSILHIEENYTKRQNAGMGKPDVEQKPSVPSLEISQLRHFNEVSLRFLPIGVVVIDRTYRIMTANGAARRLLGLREVGTNQDFLHTVRGVPYHQVRIAIDTIFRERSPINLAEVELDSITGGNESYVNLSLALVQTEAELPDFALISVTDVTQQVQVRQQLEVVQAEQRKLMSDLGTANQRLSDLNKELTDTNEGLQVANEELVLTHEELQASIEEFETTNEELQATNEELETNNEELQATNEELETTNEELRARSDELQEMTMVLENERSRLAKMVELAPFYILVLRGPSLIVEAYNPRYARPIENRPVQGQPLEKVVDLFWETGLEVVHLARETYHLDAPQSRSRVLTSFPNQDASREQAKAYFTYTSVPSHDASGKIDGVVIYALDETEKRLQEEVEEHKRLNAIFNNLSTVALALYDAQTEQLIMASARYLERAAFVHHIKPEELIGRHWQELTLIPSQEQAIQLWQTVLENQTPVHIAELSREIRPGEKMVWDNTFTPIMGADEPGKIRFVLISAFDVTERVRVREELESLGHLKDEFLSLASHELRSPLTAIQGNTQLLQRDIKKQKKAFSGNTEQEQRIDREVTLLDRIVDQTGRMNELITEMLDTARIRGQMFELKRKEGVNLVELARYTIAHYDQQCRIALRSEEKAILGTWDENRLGQVLNNLITNALKYSPADKPIVVEVKRRSGNSENEVLVSVQDQGPGIPEEDQASIFDRFYQVKGVGQEGLGLGLYISHEIVTQHGGCMWVRSSSEQGSTFYFTLPLSPPSAIQVE